MLPPPPSIKDARNLIEQLELVPGNLTVNEHAVWKLLSADDPAHIDALAEATRLSLPELTGALLALEMRELIRQLPGKCFVKKM
jgi:DNA processing protein